jgi:signal transduction histidine kinase
VKTPLNGVGLNAERLDDLRKHLQPLLDAGEGRKTPISDGERKVLRELSDELPDIIQTLNASVQQIRDLVTRFGPTIDDDDSATVDPLPVIEHAITVCRGEIRRARGQVKYDGPANLPKVKFGQVELAQVLINLIANAVHAVGERRERGGRVVVKAEPMAGAVAFSVTDDGIGMTPEVLERVGTAFFSTRREGTGLGVAQCKRLIGRQGGDLQIESTPGRGTIVRFTLKRA